MSETTPKIRIRGLYKSFGNKVVLDGVDLDVLPRTSMIVIGGSGSGKSVLLKCILGLLEPDDGLIEIDGLVGHECTTRRAKGYSALSYNCLMPPLSNLSSPTSRKAPTRSSGSRSSMAKRMACAAWAKRR